MRDETSFVRSVYPEEFHENIYDPLSRDNQRGKTFDPRLCDLTETRSDRKVSAKSEYSVSSCPVRPNDGQYSDSTGLVPQGEEIALCELHVPKWNGRRIDGVSFTPIPLVFFTTMRPMR